MARIGGLSLLLYVGGVAKADIGLMNVDIEETVDIVDNEETDRASQYH